MSFLAKVIWSLVGWVAVCSYLAHRSIFNSGTWFYVSMETVEKFEALIAPEVSRLSNFTNIEGLVVVGPADGGASDEKQAEQGKVATEATEKERLDNEAVAPAAGAAVGNQDDPKEEAKREETGNEKSEETPAEQTQGDSANNQDQAEAEKAAPAEVRNEENEKNEGETEHSEQKQEAEKSPKNNDNNEGSDGATAVAPDASEPTKEARNCAKTSGYIIANMNGRTANNLFQTAVANRLAEELCWDVIFKEAWQGVFPNNKRANQCFPNALRHQHKAQQIGNANTTLTATDLELYHALQIGNSSVNLWTNDKPERFYETISDRKNKQYYRKWLERSVADGTSLVLGNTNYNFDGKWEDKLISKLRSPSNKIRAVHLKAFFIHYDWMRPWMEKIKEWNQINVAECCHHTPTDNTVVIHARNFSPKDGQRLNPGFQKSVYFELLDKLYFNKNRSQEQGQTNITSSSTDYTLWIVCQPDDVDTELIQALKQRYNATVITGDDPYDAFCTLQQARELVLSSHSTFSQMSALLSFHKEGEHNVHYLLAKKRRPKVTLAVPHWHYHLVNKESKDRIETFNFPVDEIQPMMS